MPASHHDSVSRLVTPPVKFCFLVSSFELALARASTVPQLSGDGVAHVQNEVLRDPYAIKVAIYLWGSFLYIVPSSLGASRGVMMYINSGMHLRVWFVS
jgi:hypothetical protein